VTDRNAATWQLRRNAGLPPLTARHDEAREHLRDYGIALLAEALSADEVREARERLLDQAAAERAAGKAMLEGHGMKSWDDWGKYGSNQRVWSLINKGEIFRRLAVNPRVLRLIRDEFAADYEGPDVPVETTDVLLSSSTGNIVGKGGMPMRRHFDQRNVPFKTPYPVTFNALCMLTDFTARNGATCVAPGSHLATDPEAAYSSDVIPAVAPAGTVMLIDGRVLHHVGASTDDDLRVGILNYYCRPFIRPQENYCLSLRPEVWAVCSDELKSLLGFKSWNTFGGVDGHFHGLLPSMRPDTTGELSLRSTATSATSPRA
jgi:hypothetical protein